MLNKKTIFLFLALILPIGIFLFLKFFGRNEFFVEPLYVKEYPQVPEGCIAVKSLPYSIPDSIIVRLPLEDADLIIVAFGQKSTESVNQIRRVQEQFGNDPLKFVTLPATQQSDYWSRCVFFLKEPFDLVLVDRSGVIRGQYSSAKREDVDRLITELSIVLKKY